MRWSTGIVPRSPHAPLGAIEYRPVMSGHGPASKSIAPASVPASTATPPPHEHPAAKLAASAARITLVMFVSPPRHQVAVLQPAAIASSTSPARPTSRVANEPEGQSVVGNGEPPEPPTYV